MSETFGKCGGILRKVGREFIVDYDQVDRCCVCLCVFMCVVLACLCMLCTFMYVYVCFCMFMYVYVFLCMFMYVYLCYVCLRRFMYVTYVYVCLCTFYVRFLYVMYVLIKTKQKKTKIYNKKKKHTLYILETSTKKKTETFLFINRKNTLRKKTILATDSD